MNIRCGPLDELVAFHALRRVGELRGRALSWHRRAEATNAALAEALERHRADLQQAAHDYYVRHLIDREQFLSVRDALDRALTQERKELLPLRVREVLKRFGRKAPLVAWNDFDIPQRRQVLSVVLDHVVVDPMPGGGGRFHPERVEIFWLGQASLRPSATREVPPPRRRRRTGEHLSTQQAADYLGLNDQYVLRLLRRGELDGTRGTHGWEITQAGIDRFLEERRLRPRAEPADVEK